MGERGVSEKNTKGKNHRHFHTVQGFLKHLHMTYFWGDCVKRNLKTYASMISMHSRVSHLIVETHQAREILAK